MAHVSTPQDNDNEIEQFPIEPRYHPVNKVARSIYDLLASARLAMLLLVTILVSCLFGVTVYREQQAAEMVFGTLWFNGLLVLLVINTACCFFGRMWGRRITVITFGMILFHLSFVAMFAAIVINSLFYFDGSLRLTEGETLSNRDPKSYDIARHGLFFSFSRLKGETTLLRVHRGFRVDGEDKNIAFDVSVAEGGAMKNGTIYINNKFDYKGVEYIRDREGYSLLVVLNDRQGKELYGVHFPLQSFKQKDGSYIYSTGTMAGPGLIEFPPENDNAYFGLQLDYLTDNEKDRSGKVRYQVWPAAKMAAGHPMNSQAGGSPHGAGGAHTTNSQTSGTMEEGGGHAMNLQAHGTADNPDKHAMKRLADGTAHVGEKFAFGEYQLFVPEVRYWIAMNVRYNPGKPFVLASLCVGLAGMIITTFGRMMRGRK
jgi:ResB-like family protein